MQPGQSPMGGPPMGVGGGPGQGPPPQAMMHQQPPIAGGPPPGMNPGHPGGQPTPGGGPPPQGPPGPGQAMAEQQKLDNISRAKVLLPQLRDSLMVRLDSLRKLLVRK